MLFIYRKCVCVCHVANTTLHYSCVMYDIVGSSIGNGRTIQAGLDQTLFLFF